MITNDRAHGRNVLVDILIGTRFCGNRPFNAPQRPETDYNSRFGGARGKRRRLCTHGRAGAIAHPGDFGRVAHGAVPLDRAPRLREVAQLGSVLGCEFAYDMISALAGIEEEMLQGGLGQLVVDELLYQRGRPPRSRYLFKHALIQDAAYQSLLKRTRQQYHQQVAKLLEDRFAEVASTQPELVAHHYSEANCPAPAIAYWHKAGAAAASKSANREAIDQFHRGLTLVEALSSMRERAERELDLQMALGSALIATKGYSHPDIGRAYARARELCEQLGDRSREFTALCGLWLYHINLLELEKAQHFAEEAMRVAERLDDAARLVGAHVAVGVTLYHQGKTRAGACHFRRGFEMFDPQQQQVQDWPGAHPAVACQFYPMLISWMLGYPDRSLDELRTAVRNAETFGHPLSLARTLCWAAACLHLSPRAVGGRRLCQKGIEDLRGAAHRSVAGLCSLRTRMGASPPSGESERGWPKLFKGWTATAVGRANICSYRRLVLAQAFIDDLAQEIVFGPGQELDIDNKLGPDPMHAAENEWRSKAGRASLLGLRARKRPPDRNIRGNISSMSNPACGSAWNKDPV